MSRTVYRNASGLPDPEQVTTARDLTILARAIQDRFPKHYRYFQTRVFNYAGAAPPQPQQAARPGRGRRRHQDRLHPRLRLQPDDHRPGPTTGTSWRSCSAAAPARAATDHGRARPDEPAARLCRRPHRAGRSRKRRTGLARRSSPRPTTPSRAREPQVDTRRRRSRPRRRRSRSRSTSPRCGRSSPRADDADHDAHRSRCAGARARSRSRRSAGLCAGRGRGRAAAAPHPLAPSRRPPPLAAAKIEARLPEMTCQAGAAADRVVAKAEPAEPPRREPHRLRPRPPRSAVG